jgi:hypothetical protein
MYLMYRLFLMNLMFLTFLKYPSPFLKYPMFLKYHLNLMFLIRP